MLSVPPGKLIHQASFSLGKRTLKSKIETL